MSLTTLPTELIEAITRHLDLPSVLHLRLTSPSLCEQTLHPFKSRYLRSHTLKWDVASFSTLLRISQHPQFRSALTTLYIDATPHYFDRTWKLQKAVQDGERMQFNEQDPSFYAVQEEKIAATKAADAYNHFWNESQEDVTTLVSVFANCSANLKEIVFAYTGIERQYSQFGLRYCESSQLEMSRPVVRTLRAIALTPSLGLASLSFSPTQDFGAVSIGRLETLSPLLPRFDAAFAALTTLRLNLRDWRKREEGFEDPPGRIPFVVRFLAKCTRLRDLRLSCFSGLEGDVLVREMALCCEWRELRALRLGHVRVFDVDDVLALMRKSYGSLETLGLESVWLKDRSERGWAHFLHCVADAAFPALRDVALRCVLDADGCPVGRGDDWPIRVEDRGVRVLGVDNGPGEGTQRFAEGIREVARELNRAAWGVAYFRAVVRYPFRAER